MNCDDARAELTAWLDGELGRDEESLLAAHLQACTACRAEERQLRALRRLVDHELKGAPAPLAPDSFERVWEQRPVSGLDHSRASGGSRRGLEASRPAGRRGLRWAVPAGLALAASLAILVVRTMPPEQTGGVSKPAVDAKESPPTEPVQKPAPARAPAPSKPAEVIAAVERKPAAVPAPTEPQPKSDTRASQTKPLPGGVVALGDAPPMDAEAISADAIPAELRERPGLFVDYAIVRRLDQLRHLDELAPEPSRAGSKGTG